MGKACELAKNNMDNHMKYLKDLRDYFISRVENEIPYVKLNGSRTNRLPGNANFSFDFIEGESLLLNLDEKGICVSSGSACTSGSSKPSHVLTAIGLSDKMAHSAVRITFGEDNTMEDVNYLIESLKDIIQRLRNRE